MPIVGQWAEAACRGRGKDCAGYMPGGCQSLQTLVLLRVLVRSRQRRTLQEL